MGQKLLMFDISCMTNNDNDDNAWIVYSGMDLESFRLSSSGSTIYDGRYRPSPILVKKSPYKRVEPLR